MKIEEMSRPEVIQELAKHAHHSWYKKILGWKTKDLKSLLSYYRGEMIIMPSPRRAGRNTWGMLYPGLPYGFMTMDTKALFIHNATS